MTSSGFLHDSGCVIVVDTSAVIAVLIGEMGSEAPHDLMKMTADLLMSAGTYAEGLIVASRKGHASAYEAAIEAYGIAIVSLTAHRAELAAHAYDRFGKGVHPASLNICDCFAYALAKELDCPLLFVGDDFRRTDIIAAYT
jgi:ribonuclease VapC